MCALSVCAPRGPRKTDVFYIHISLMVVCRVSLHLFPLHLHTHMPQRVFSCTCCTRAHAHVSCDRTGVSSEFFVCSLSRCHTQTHHTRVFLYVCVCSLLLLRICTHSRCVGFVWVEKVENNDGFSCLSGRSRQDVCECVFVSLRCSDALIHKGKHFLLFAVLATPSVIS